MPFSRIQTSVGRLFVTSSSHKFGSVRNCVTRAMTTSSADASAAQDAGVPGPKHNQEAPVVWERWQKKRTFVRALEGTYSHLTKELLDAPRVISSKSVPWKGGPNLYGKHPIAPGAAAKITQAIECHESP